MSAACIRTKPGKDKNHYTKEELISKLTQDSGQTKTLYNFFKRVPRSATSLVDQPSTSSSPNRLPGASAERQTSASSGLAKRRSVRRPAWLRRRQHEADKRRKSLPGAKEATRKRKSLPGAKGATHKRKSLPGAKEATRKRKSLQTLFATSGS